MYTEQISVQWWPLIVVLTLECFTPHSRLFTRYAEEEDEEEEEEDRKEDEDKVEETVKCETRTNNVG